MRDVFGPVLGVLLIIVADKNGADGLEDGKYHVTNQVVHLSSE